MGGDERGGGDETGKGQGPFGVTRRWGSVVMGHGAKLDLGIREVLAASAEECGDLGTDESQVTKLRAVREVEEVESWAVNSSGDEADAVVEVEGPKARADNVRRAEQLAVRQVEKVECLGLAAVRRLGAEG